MVTQKCQYAIKALLDLALRGGSDPVKIAEIAEAQVIPVRFLEIILGQLKRGGFVVSRRGADGGYVLAREPVDITLRDIVQFVDGPFDLTPSEDPAARLLEPIWRAAQEASLKVCEAVSIADLAQIERERHQQYILDYSI